MRRLRVARTGAACGTATRRGTRAGRPVTRTGILLLGFGEPATWRITDVLPFLERIFERNGRLEAGGLAVGRARQLAARRAPGLVEEYRLMGGSPLVEQLERQARMLADTLAARNCAVVVRAGMQFTEPGIPAAVDALRADGVGSVVALPVYPLTGPSTSIAALEDLELAVRRSGWIVPVREVLGWHTHPDYVALRADGVRRTCREAGLDLRDPSTSLVFCAHGTPLTYLRDGSRYDRYVDEHCRRLAQALGGIEYVRGYQNHSNRPGVVWTEPEIGRVLAGLEAERVVLVPVSYMQEQSETLAGMDHDLRKRAGERGLEYHRVPVPHDDPRFGELLADLVEPLLDPRDSGATGFRDCACRGAGRAVCRVEASAGVETRPAITG